MVGFFKSSLLAWCLNCAFSPMVWAEPKVQTAEGKHFEVAGFDRASVQFVLELGEQVLRDAERYLGEQPDRFPQRVLITLRTVDNTADAWDYQMSIEPGGFVRVDFNWREDLSLWKLCRGIVDGYLARYAIYHYGYGAPVTVKAWVVSALAAQTYVSLRPSVVSGWLEFAEDNTLPLFPSLLKTADGSRSNDMETAAYFLVMAQRVADFSRDEISRFLRAGVAGYDVSPQLTERIQSLDPEAPAVTLNDWWKACMGKIFSEPVFRFKSLSGSERWILDLSSMVDFDEAGVAPKNLRDLWRFRNELPVRRIVERRLGQIVSGIDRVNPAYRNTLQSLGMLYEQLLAGDEEHAYIFSLTGFLGDFADSRRLREDMEAVLQNAGFD